MIIQQRIEVESGGTRIGAVSHRGTCLSFLVGRSCRRHIPLPILLLGQASNGLTEGKKFASHPTMMGFGGNGISFSMVTIGAHSNPQILS